MSSAKIAIVGGGAAAAGVLQGLLRSGQRCDVTIFHPHQRLHLPAPTNIPDYQDRPAEYSRALYRHLRREHGFKFPPPKTLFGASLQRRRTSPSGQLWDSAALGGLTNFWGASAVPFTARELANWMIDDTALAEYYEGAAEHVDNCRCHRSASEHAVFLVEITFVTLTRR